MRYTRLKDDTTDERGERECHSDGESSTVTAAQCARAFKRIECMAETFQQ